MAVSSHGTPPGSVSTGHGSLEAARTATDPGAVTSRVSTLNIIASMAKTATVFADSETDLDLGACARVHIYLLRVSMW